MNLDFYSLITILIVLTAAFSYLNARFIKLPATIGIMLISLICSIVIQVLGKLNPAIVNHSAAALQSLDFEDLLMRMMLSFLLFAGAIHIDVHKLKREFAPIAIYATVGVLISTAIIGSVMFFVFQWFGLAIPFLYCLLFGALISPTDPIAVLAILREARIPPSMEIKIAGESLFNDGVGVVVFVSILEVALMGTDNISVSQTAWLFLKEAGGGLLWGLMLGYLGYYLVRSIDHYQVEVIITLAIVMGGYLLASYLHISGPLAMVVAGIITGNKGKEEAMSDLSRDYLVKFWELIDEILNAVLFLLVGLEMILLSFQQNTIIIGIIAIAVVLVARFVSVWLPSFILSFRRSMERSLVPILTWGGLRGGISIALALSLPKNDYRDLMVSITYIIVVFSILVQGLTIGKLARKLNKTKPVH